MLQSNYVNNYIDKLLQTYLVVLALKPQIHLLCLGLVRTSGFGFGLRYCWPWMNY